MPKDKVEAAIKRASGRDATNYHEATYEGDAPHGVARCWWRRRPTTTRRATVARALPPGTGRVLWAHT